MTTYTVRDIRDAWKVCKHRMTQDRLRVPVPIRSIEPITSASEFVMPLTAVAQHIEFYIERDASGFARVVGIIPGSDVGVVPVTPWVA